MFAASSSGGYVTEKFEECRLLWLDDFQGLKTLETLDMCFFPPLALSEFVHYQVKTFPFARNIMRLNRLLLCFPGLIVT